ncbi:hypothetical protein QTP70_033314, partial [Hemibagrus guttatus]
GRYSHGLETVSLRKRQESELEVAELKMLRFSLGVTRLDRIRNEYIRGTAHVGRLGDKVREARLRWFGHVQRRESEYIGRRMLDMELPGRRQRGRAKRRYMDGINEDMKLVGATVEDAEDRDRWREMIRCGDPSREKPKEEEEWKIFTWVVAVDFIILEPAKDGHENVLVVTNVFTKFSQAFHTNDQKAETMTKILL